MSEEENIDEYDLWLKIQINCLKSRNFTQLDCENLIEELEELGKAEKSSVKILAFEILIHLLLVDYWTEESVCRKNHWQAEINTLKYQLSDKLTTNYKLFLTDNLDRIYSKARTNAILKSNLDCDRFPDTCPYRIKDLILIGV